VRIGLTCMIPNFVSSRPLYRLLFFSFSSQPAYGPMPLEGFAPSTPFNQQTRFSTKISCLGAKTVSCKSKSSMVPILGISMPGMPDETRYMSVPQTEQKWFSIVLPLAIVLLCANLVSLSRPRVCTVSDSLTMKLEANIEAVILRQSLQLQTKVSTRPGAVVGCFFFWMC
jgi:hypothetical protein